MTAVLAPPFTQKTKSRGLSRRLFSIVPLVIVVLFSIPILTVVMNLLRQDEGTLHHLMQTVFFSYVVNSFTLLIGVVAGTCAVGAGDRSFAAVTLDRRVVGALLAHSFLCSRFVRFNRRRRARARKQARRNQAAFAPGSPTRKNRTPFNERWQCSQQKQPLPSAKTTKK